MAIKCPKCHFENPDNTVYCGKCASPLKPAEVVSVTKTIETPVEEYPRGSTFADRYKIIEKLGTGGMGAVYRVEDTNIGQDIALKLIKSDIASDKNTIERFRNELKTTRMISHRNVCRMFDLAETEGTYYITMEYVPGEDLKSLIRRVRRLDSATAITIAKQVCEGLSEAHGLGVVHRDLKSSNIMIDKEGNVRIMDFGIARSHRTKGITGEGIIIGTPEYMSPEQVEGKEIDQRSDIYSLGIILYEMVTGRVPFDGDTPFTIGTKHTNEIPKDPKEINSQIPNDLSRAILKCLEKDKERRYQSAGELCSALINIEKEMPTAERIVSKRKPITLKEITVTFKLRKLFIPGLAVIAIAIIAVAVWQFLPSKEALPIATGKPTLAVMYFKNNTGDESLDNWRSALSDLLTADLNQSKYIRVLSGDKIIDILSELDQLESKVYSSKILKEVAVRGRATHILQGNYTRAGDTFRINTALQEARTMETIDSEMVEGKGEESFYSMVDELTRRIKLSFRLSEEEIAGDIDKQVGQITTSSPEALKYFSEGSRCYWIGENRKAIQFFEKAITLDPEFALAYRYLGGAYANLGYPPTKYSEYRQKAFELSDRVSDRERYRIQGDFYRRSEKTYKKAFEAFNKLLELYPDDWLGNNSLGVLYETLEDWDKAKERYGVNVENKVEVVFSYVNLAGIYGYMGSYDKAREVLEFYINNITDNARVRRGLAENYLRQGKYELALAEAEKAFSLNPTDYNNILLKGDIFYLKGDLDKAEEEYQKLMLGNEGIALAWSFMRLSSLYLLQGRFEESKKQLKVIVELTEKAGEKAGERYIRNLLAYIHVKTGNPEESLEELEKAWRSAVEAEDLDMQRNVLHKRGHAYIEKETIDQALKTADQLKDLIEKAMNKKLMRQYHDLMGMIELRKENFLKAIGYFKRTLSLLPYHQASSPPLYLDHLALAFYKSGDLENAREEYEKITRLTTGRLHYGDIYAKAFYMLGKICEQQGNTAKAIENYEKFLDLWKDADPGIAEVEDARKRLAELKSQ